MKLHIQKSAEGIIDTDRERRRIENAFSNAPTVKKKLTEFMDAIEALDWKLALKQLESKWWKGYDNKAGCPRLEFIGLLFVKDMKCKKQNYAFGNDASYIDLVVMMNRLNEDFVYEIGVL